MSSQCASGSDAAIQRFQAFSKTSLNIDGKDVGTAVRDVSALVHIGSVIKFTFTLNSTPNCDNTYVGISSYKAPTPYFDAKLVSEQKLLQRQGGAFKAKQQNTIQVTMPQTCYQLDINTGAPFTVGDFKLDYQGRLLFTATGGPKNCVPPVTTPKKPATTTTSSTTTSTSTTVIPVKPAQATASTVCKADASGWNVTLKAGNTNTTFAITTSDNMIDKTVIVPANKTQVVGFSFGDSNIAAGDTVHMTVKVGDTTVLTTPVTNSCEKPQATITSICLSADQGAQVSYMNKGELPETFTASINGKVFENSIALNKGETKTNTYSFAQLGIQAGDSFTIEVVANGVTLATATKTDICQALAPTPTASPAPPAASSPTPPAQVLSEQITKPELPNTGFDPMPYVFLGIMLLTLGAGLLLLAHRLRFPY